jgi:hypothetical protein
MRWREREINTYALCIMLRGHGHVLYIHKYICIYYILYYVHVHVCICHMPCHIHVHNTYTCMHVYVELEAHVVSSTSGQ